jgi:hypothetical protein
MFSLLLTKIFINKDFCRESMFYLQRSAKLKLLKNQGMLKNKLKKDIFTISTEMNIKIN